MLKVAIIGVSGYGKVHYTNILEGHKLGKVLPIAATIINQDEEQEKCAELISLGCQLYTDYNEMLKIHGHELDICFIPTGIPFHAPMSIASVKAGCNVYVEKPAAGTCSEVEAMQAAENETGKFIAIGYQSIYSQGVQNLKKYLLGGELGKIKEIKSRGIWPRARTYYDRNNWAGKLKSGDHYVYDCPFNNAMAHYLNIICFLSGETFETSGKIKSLSAEMYKANDIESCDTASIIIDTEEGPTLKFYTTHAAKDIVPISFFIKTEKGHIEWEIAESVKIYLDNKCIKEIENPMDNIGQEVLDLLIQKVSNPKTFTCTLDIAGTQTKVTEEVFKSHPIKEVYHEFISKHPAEDGSTFTVIQDINETLLGAYEKGSHLSETKAPWTQK